MHDATERQFMTALEKTNDLLHFKEFIRSRGDDTTYRGPQSFVHKNDAARMSYRVQNSLSLQNKTLPSLVSLRTRFFNVKNQIAESIGAWMLNRVKYCLTQLILKMKSTKSE